MPPSPLTIPPHILRLMIRVYGALIMLLYTAFGINFLALPLSVTQYGGVYANKWIWGPLFLFVALWLSYGFADGRMGRLLASALLASIGVSGMWLFAATVTTLIGQINYVSPFVWLFVLCCNILVFIAHAFANPQAALVPPRWHDALATRLMRWLGRQKG